MTKYKHNLHFWSVVNCLLKTSGSSALLSGKNEHRQQISPETQIRDIGAIKPIGIKGSKTNSCIVYWT
jgi:hypothetical protein